MEILCERDCKESIKLSLKNSLTYDEYTKLMNNLVENNSTTGTNQSDALINYTMLNQRRMKRWNKTLKVNNEIEVSVAESEKKITWLVITESWCGDAAHMMPVMNKIANLSENIDLKIVIRDENLDLMDAFLTNGSRSIPKLIMIDETTGEVVNTYGPRPNILTKEVIDYKNKNDKITEEFKQYIQKWYNADKGRAIINDLQNIM